MRWSRFWAMAFWLAARFAATASAQGAPAIAPQNFQGSALGTSSIAWTWDLLAAATGYNVYLCARAETCEPSGSSVTLVQVQTTYYHQIGLARNTIYHARVSGFAGGEGPVSSTATATTLSIAAGELSPDQTAEQAFVVSGSTLQVTVVTGTFSGALFTSLTPLDPAAYDAGSPVASFGAPLVVFDFNAGGAQPSKPLTFRLCYPVSALPAGTDETGMTLAFRDASGWLPLSTTLDLAAHCATADVMHLSVFALLARQAGSGGAGAAVVWPSPFHAGRSGYGTVNITKAPPGTRIKVYTLAGERVRSLTADALGEARWDARNESGSPVASGVYLILLDGPGGKTVKKIGIQR